MSFNFHKFTTSHERAKYIAFIASLFALLYHIGVLICFFVIGLKFMFFYNIFSVTLFAITTITVPKVKRYILHYILTAVEVVIHQILCDYFLSGYSSFHFYILLIALLPSMVFEEKHILSVPFTFITALLFILLEIYDFPGTFVCPNVNQIIYAFRIINVSLTVIAILAIVIVFTYIALKNEKELNKSNLKLQTEINLAAIIQQSFFHQEKTDFDEWELEYYNKPLAGVSGDFFDIYHKDNVLEGFGLMDVSGHGISSGMITMMTRNIILKEFNRDLNIPLNKTVDKINARLISEKGNINNYLTGVLVRLSENNLEFVNAGHPSPLLYKKSTNTVEIIKRSEEGYGPIGIKDLPVVFDTQYASMDSGDEFILYTDGITEAQNGQNQQYGVNHLAKTIEKLSDFSATEQITKIVEDVSAFTNNREQSDDITIMILRKK